MSKSVTRFGLISAAVACFAFAATPSTASETKDRITREQMAASVKDATNRIDQGVVRARLTFQRKLEAARDHGKPTVKSVDLLSAFGVELWIRKMREDSAEYLRKAAEEAEAVYGPKHPEVALAWSDYAEVLRVDVLNPPSEVDEILTKVLDIRLATLGASDGETLMSELYLGQVEGLPSRTHLEDDKISKAINRIEGAFARSPGCKNLKAHEPGWMLYSEALIYLRNNRLPQAMKAFHRLAEFAKEHPDGPGPAFYAQWFGGILIETGHWTEADMLKTEYPMN